MNISWFNTDSVDYENVDAADLTMVNNTLEASYGNDPIKQNMWVVNNGSDDGNFSKLYEVGFWIDSDKTEDLVKILKLSGTSDLDGRPYGLFLVFGYTNDAGDTSWLSLFEDQFENGITSILGSDMLQFQFNWNQGTSILNKIMMKAENAYTYNGSSGYVKRTTLAQDNGYLNADGSGRGALKATLYLRVPDSGSALLSNIRLNLHGVEALS
jgi:hypothetical protein